jgi:hypothetical protein
VAFKGPVVSIRRDAAGQASACVPDGDSISAFGHRITGHGPWTYNLDADGKVDVTGTPRPVKVEQG